MVKFINTRTVILEMCVQHFERKRRLGKVFVLIMEYIVCYQMNFIASWPVAPHAYVILYDSVVTVGKVRMSRLLSFIATVPRSILGRNRLS